MNPKFFDILLTPPERVVQPYSWAGHIPFALLLIELARPRVLVELGTHSGNSYTAFCQGVARAAINCQCHAVDTWLGDPHAGLYGPEIHAELLAYHTAHFGSFSHLLRMSFDAARDQFADGSIDLLHIDGLHTYEAVCHDFETWLPKLSDRAIVLIHDTQVRRPDFGVWQFWSEVAERFPALEFLHCNGLGLLATGQSAPAEISALIEADPARKADLLKLCERLGTALVATHELQDTLSKLEQSNVRLQQTDLRCEQLQTEIAHNESNWQQVGYESCIRDLERQAKEQRMQHELQDTLIKLEQSNARLQQTQQRCEQLEADCEHARQQTEIAHSESRRQRDGYESYIRNLERQAKEYYKQLGAKETALASLYASRSWRITQPLRLSSGAAKQGLRKVQHAYHFLPLPLRSQLRPYLHPLKRLMLDPPPEPPPQDTGLLASRYRDADSFDTVPPGRLDFIAAAEPGLSIVVAASEYKLSERCLATLLSQCRALAYEMIVCGTPDCVSALAAKISGVKLVANPDPSAVALLAAGIAASRAARILFVSDRCLPLPGSIDELLRATEPDNTFIVPKLVTRDAHIVYPQPRECASDSQAPQFNYLRRIISEMPPAFLAARELLAENTPESRLAGIYQPLAEFLAVGATPLPSCTFVFQDAGPHVLILDLLTPTPDMDSGSVDAFFQMQLLIEMGYRVSFAAVIDLSFHPRYTADLQRLGVECLYQPHVASIAAHLEQANDRYSFVILSRLPTAQEFIGLVRQECPRARILFNTVDLHFLREARQAKLENNAMLERRAEETRQREIQVMRSADATLVISAVEAALLKEAVPDIRCFHLPLVMKIDDRREMSFDERHDVFFIGGYKHLPNVDAVLHFAKHVWPTISHALQGIRFHIVGSHLPAEIEALASNSIVVAGFVADASPYFNGCRLSLAPLRFGAGLKGKVGRSLGYGCPVVASPIAAEGMALRNGEDILIADDDATFAAAVIRAYTDADLWQRLAQGGCRYFDTHFSLAAGRARLATILSELASIDPQR